MLYSKIDVVNNWILTEVLINFTAIFFYIFLLLEDEYKQFEGEF